MCGQGCLSRARTVDSGSLMAIIHPTGHGSEEQRFPGATLRLHNPLLVSSPTVSTLSFSGSSGRSSRAASPCGSETSTSSSPTVASTLHIQIHQSTTASQVLHAFDVDAADDMEGAVSSKLPQRLELSVGGDGIVGRAVSVLDGEQVRILGQGVVGYGS
jgi:hypothetical protein